MCVCVCFTDIKKMPLGKLSKMQIAKGFEVLEEIEKAMNQRSGRGRLEELSSKFFTTIPHNFGRTRPPTINDKEIVEKKKEMLMARFLKKKNLLLCVQMSCSFLCFLSLKVTLLFIPHEGAG